MEAETPISPIQNEILPHSDFSLLFYLRFIFYIVFALKLIEIVFARRRKLKIGQRIQRKFLFAHGPDMIKNFSNEEYQLMNITLRNTLRNATLPLSKNPKKVEVKIGKRISFETSENKYYDPLQSSESWEGKNSVSIVISTDKQFESNQAQAEEQEAKAFDQPECNPLLVNIDDLKDEMQQ